MGMVNHVKYIKDVKEKGNAITIDPKMDRIVGQNEKKNPEEIISQLFKIIEELDARDCSSNCIHPEFSGTGWSDLCEQGIKLFEELKQ